jgi:4-hydroxythreonine-4-phosphate dehydrogenase
MPGSPGPETPRLPVAVSCGDPAGIGAEIALAARAALGATLPFFWIGDPAHLPQGAAFEPITRPSAAREVAPGLLPVLPIPFPRPVVPGRPDPGNAAATVEAIARAVSFVQGGEASAVCTLPVAKSVLKAGAGFAFPGHTEFLAHLAGDVPVAMMLACEGLRVVPVTIHIPLVEVPRALGPDLLARTLRITRDALVTDFAIARPRIAVAGLNPHAGEGGTMGREEVEMIAPVLESLRAEGFDLAGPMPADTMFHPAARARYDAAVCMYHDQALIPIKTIDFAGGANVTLGLPFVRTSPDHGTAFDIAGKGLADPSSFIAALRMAAQIAAARAGQHGER